MITTFMTLTTIFALFGDDIRKWMTYKESDAYFFIGLILSLILFSLELLVNSCVIDEFKYSFFFWLDFVATLSLVPDIDWLSDFINGLLGMSQSPYDVDVVIGESLSNTFDT